MPNYNDNVGGGDGNDGFGGQNAANIQRMQMAMDQVNSRIDKMLNLFGKVRDYTRDEIQEMKRFKAEVSAVADAERQANADRIKGMSNYSVYLLKIEEQIESYKKASLKAEEEIKIKREQNTKLSQTTTGRFNKEHNQQLREILKTNETNSAKLRNMAKERMTENDKQIKQSKEQLDLSKKQATLAEDNQKKAVQAARSAEQRFEKEKRNRLDLLELASDLHLPGVSHAATIAKYARRGAEMGGGDDEGGGAMGAMGLLGRVGGGLGGAALGGAVAFGGYSAYQAYKAYNLAHQMAPTARTLGGQMGAGSFGGRLEAQQAYGGYGGMENLQLLTQLNRGLGGSSGLRNLRGTTDISNMFGLDRGEVAGQLGGGFAAGMNPKTAAEDMKSIMIEGVKGGMDRARITEFTQNVLSIQREIFKISSDNDADSIAKSLADLMRGSQFKDDRFFNSAAYQGVQGLDSAVKSAGRGQLQGPAAATLYRSFGYGQSGSEFGMGAMMNAQREMEKGLFGSGDSGKDLERLRSIFNQYGKESGGRDEGKFRMSRELGIGLNQLDELDKILQKGPGKVSKEDLEKVKKLQQSAQDPMKQLLDIQAKSNELLANLAGNSGIGAIVKIDQQLLTLQGKAVDLLGIIAQAIAPDKKGGVEQPSIGDMMFGSSTTTPNMFQDSVNQYGNKVSGWGRLKNNVRSLLPSWAGGISGEEADRRNLTPYQLQQAQGMMEKGREDLGRMKGEHPDSMLLKNFDASPRKFKYGTKDSVNAGGYDSSGNSMKELVSALKENTKATTENSKTSKTGGSSHPVGHAKKTVSAGAVAR